MREAIEADLFRVWGEVSFNKFIRAYFFSPGFKYLFWFRISSSLYFTHKYRKVALYPLYIISRLLLRHYSYKYGIDIPCGSNIAKGFYIGHFSCIVISRWATIEKNCNISQGVTIGYSSRGKKQGYPKIGENVYVGPGAKVIGRIEIGDNVAIGANAVVLSDVPANGVVAGIPAKLVSMRGSEGYILNKV